MLVQHAMNESKGATARNRQQGTKLVDEGAASLRPARCNKATEVTSLAG